MLAVGGCVSGAGHALRRRRVWRIKVTDDRFLQASEFLSKLFRNCSDASGIALRRRSTCVCAFYLRCHLVAGQRNFNFVLCVPACMGSATTLMRWAAGLWWSGVNA